MTRRWVVRGTASVMLIAAVAAPAAAPALSYKTGTYKQGGQSGFRQTGIRITISAHSFDVGRILMVEACQAPGQNPIHDFGGFQQSTGDTLTGTITANGGLSGEYRDGQGGYTQVTGHISGRNLVVSGTEFSHYTPTDSTARYTCHATGTFHPSLS
jgi:hypothetical protein